MAIEYRTLDYTGPFPWRGIVATGARPMSNTVISGDEAIMGHRDAAAYGLNTPLPFSTTEGFLWFEVDVTINVLSLGPHNTGDSEGYNFELMLYDLTNETGLPG